VAYTTARRKIPRGVDAALVVVVVGGGEGRGGGKASATRLLGEFLMGDLRKLRIGPRAAKKWRGSSEGRWKQRRRPRRPAVATTVVTTTTTTSRSPW
jgi:hypothetical protein